ncbi:hypothetical protein PPACK8108_LOCUS19817, partial [Phakopsora pachyrhizi]
QELEILKILTKSFVIRVESLEELADWLLEITLEIGIRPYKGLRQDLRRDLRLDLSGSKGLDNEDTYIKMLSSLTRVTDLESRAIVRRFPTIKKLYLGWKKFEDMGDFTGAESMLVGCNASGKGRSIGKVMSKRIYEVMYKALDGKVYANN